MSDYLTAKDLISNLGHLSYPAARHRKRRSGPLHLWQRPGHNLSSNPSTVVALRNDSIPLNEFKRRYCRWRWSWLDSIRCQTQPPIFPESVLSSNSCGFAVRTSKTVRPKSSEALPVRRQERFSTHFHLDFLRPG
jgi:hypothetical protein